MSKPLLIGSVLSSLLVAYYTFKPVMPLRLRYWLRRWIARRTLAKTKDWPIKPGSESPPQNWPGWPEGKKFAVVLTHDVEDQRGLDRCRLLMELEERYGFRSSFNFVPDGKYEVSRALREHLVHHGFEVGIHDLYHDGSLFRSREEFEKQVHKINRYVEQWGVSGFRAGFMFHNLGWQRKLKVLYDTSTFDVDPFEPQPDGVNTVFPFWVEGDDEEADGYVRLPHSQEETNGYVELPYTLAQDSTLFLLLRERTIDLWKRKLDWVAEHGGMVMLNTHPDYMAFDRDKPSWKEYPAAYYSELLDYVRTKYAGLYWQPLPKEVAAHCARFKPKPAASVVSRPDFNPPKLQKSSLAGKRAAVLLFSHYPSDPRPRRAAEAMAQAGMSVDLICLREDETEPTRENIEGVSVRRLPITKRRDSKLAYVLCYSQFLSACWLILAGRTLSKRYDVVHVHNMPDILVFSALVPRLFGAKLILDLHDPMPELMSSIYNLPASHWLVRWLTRLEAWSVAFAHLVLTPNIAFRDIFVARRCPAKKIRIVMNSPKREIFDPAKFNQNGAVHTNGGFKLMYHGLLVERHGLDTAIHAVARLREDLPALSFHIYGGETPYMEKMQSLIDELGLANVVHYHGRKPLAEIAGALAASDLGVIPNRRNPFTEVNMPTRIFENLAMGKPVIVPRTKGIRDYFDESQLVFFEPDDPKSLADAIRWVYSNPEEVKQMIGRARPVLESHAWDSERKAFLDHVRGLVREV